MKKFVLLFLFFVKSNAFGIRDFEITLDKDQGIYNPGDVVSGNFKQVSGKSSELKIKEITMDFIGVIRTAKFDRKGVILSSTQIDLFKESKTISPGSSKFSFKLPKSLPMSIDYYKNVIKYSLIAHVKLEDGRIHRVPERILTVLGGIDLSKDSKKYEKIGKCENTTALGSVWSTPFKISAEIDKVGYVSGEEIDIKLKIDSESKWTLSRIEFNLVVTHTTLTKKGLNNTMKSTDPIPKTSDKKNIEVFTRTYDAESSAFLNTAELHYSKIPSSFKINESNWACPPTVLPGTQLISVEYVVRVTAVMFGPTTSRTDVRCEIPVTIGVVPTKNSKLFGKKPKKYLPQQQGSTGSFFSSTEAFEFNVLYPHWINSS